MVQRPSGRPAFTLVEVLVASALVTLVLGMAMKGFIESKKIADLTRSKIIAAEEATLGVTKLAKLVKRCHIVYFTARPLDNHSTNTDANAVQTAFDNTTGTNNYDNALDTAQIPARLRTEPAGGTVRWQQGAFPFAAMPAVDRNSFRFRSTAQLLQSADPSLPKVNPWDDGVFTSPLFFGAEATFNTGRAQGQQSHTGIPMTWTFYIVYLAPMSFNNPQDIGHALFPARAGLNQQRDQGIQARAAAPTPFNRSTVPYELRLVTIPDVRAVQATAPNANSAANNFGRRMNASGDIQPAPHDAAANTLNYDPIPLAIGFPQNLDRNVAEFGGAGSGARVNGAKHGNFSNLGNDPPTTAALADAQRGKWNGQGFDAAEPLTDTVIARYIDPDATTGTFVKLAVDESWSSIFPEANRRTYVPAYGGPQRNRYRLFPATGTATIAAELSAPPKRAYVGVTTRYRNTTQVPFQFSTETVEVDLEALERYQTLDRTSPL